MTDTRAQEIAGKLTKAARTVMTHERFVDRGWEPPNPFSPVMVELVDAGCFRRADGRCGYERFKDSFVIPTETGLAVRRILQETRHD